MQLAATFSDAEAAMQAAIEIARKGVAVGEVGIGAVVLGANDECIALRHDEVRSSRDPMRHAAVLALRDAALAIGSWRLVGCQLFVTREPCALCAGAALSSRVRGVVIGALDAHSGCAGSRYHFGADPRLNHEFAVTYGVLAEVADALYEESLGESG